MSNFEQLFSSSEQQADFIKSIWQQQPLFLKKSVEHLNTIIDADTLMDLSCESEIESRIIAGHGISDQWSCQNGPFNDDTFEQLPEQNWTLLVQGVDQWIEEISHVLASFAFLPRWRLEDIMASYAPKGGGVGPHFDYYDVFLLQVSGTREWLLGEVCNDSTALQENDQVKLLSEFTVQQDYIAEAGDLLYIPAGVAHWGTAKSNDCITLSVGLRAPSKRELIIATLGNLADSFSESERYKDTVESIDSHSAKINSAVHKELSLYLQSITPELLEASINKAFGQLVTEPRYTNVDDEPPQDFVKIIIQELRQNSCILLEHPIHSRFAFSDQQLFVNGEAYDVTEDFAKGICDGKVTSSMTDKEMVFLVELLERGDIALA